MRDRSWTRRTVLATGIGSFVATLAGCTGRSKVPPGSSRNSGAGPPDGNSVYEDISFDGGAMVVELREGHDVSQVNLIAPDGTGFAQAEVPAGATTVRMTILDIEPLGADYEHYTPGIYGLVAITNSKNETQQIELVPNLQIKDVEYRSDEMYKGNLVVEVANTGTAPTWAYEIVYEGAPNETANHRLSDTIGIPSFSVPTESRVTLLLPGEHRPFAGASRPLSFRDEGSSACARETFEFTLTVGAAAGNSPSQRIRVVTGGESISVGLTGEYVCSEVETTLIDN